MELFTLFGKIAIENGDANRAIDSTVDKAKSLGSAIGSGLGKAGNVVGTVLSKVGDVAIFLGKATAAGVAAGAAGVAALTNAAVQGYADYEQLVGGVETLLGTRGAKSVEEYAEITGKSVKYCAAEYEMLQETQELVMNNAANAYKTATLSMNDYMEAAVNLAPALNQVTVSQRESAELTDMAIRDISDNNNKLGTSYEAVQNAYMGFAKQNYTMLDNLRLGYGGTREEMKRLINDAAKIDKSVRKNDLSLDNIIKAIHAVQDETGITGTTAKEAEETISGSVATMKAAWSNLVVEMAKDNGNIETSVKNFTDSVSTAAGNILPRIQTALSGVGELIVALTPVVTTGLTTLIEELAPAIPEVLQTLLPALITGAATLLSSLVESMPQLISVLVECAPMVIDAFGQLVGAVSQAMPGVWAALNPAIAEGIAWALSAIGVEVETSDVIAKIDSIVAGVKGVIDTLGTELARIGGTIRDKFQKIADTLSENGVTIEDVFTGLQTAIELVASAVDAACGAIGEALNLLADWATTDGTYLNTALKNVGTSLTAVAEAATHLFKAIDLALQGDWAGAAEEAKLAFDAMAEGAKEGFDRTLDYANTKMSEIAEVVNNRSIALPKPDTTQFDTSIMASVEYVNTLIRATSNLGGSSFDIRSGYTPNIPLDGSHASGLDYVPFNGYIAELHKGEMVVPAAEAAALRSGAGNGEVLSVLNQILAVLSNQDTRFGASMREAMEGVSLSMNNREFGRLVNAAVKG